MSIYSILKRINFFVGATFSDVEGLEIASGTSRYRKILLGVKYGRTYDDWARKCHGRRFETF